MGGCAVLLLLAFVAMPASAARFWQRVAEPVDTRVILIESSADELAALRAQYGNMGGRSDTRNAFTLLTRNRDTGEWVCRIYLTKSTPKVLAHEMRHCEGWIHG